MGAVVARHGSAYKCRLRGMLRSMPTPRRARHATASAAGSTRPTRATIFDVARVAGVSHATVSRVVNGRQNVRDETRERVEVAMRELGYVAHVSARALASGRTQVIGLL